MIVFRSALFLNLMCLLTVRIANADAGDIRSRITEAHKRHSQAVDGVRITLTEAQQNGRTITRAIWKSGSFVKLHSDLVSGGTVLTTDSVVDNPSTVESFGGGWLFRLRRPTADGALVVRNVVRVESRELEDHYVGQRDARLSQSINVATSVMGVPLAEMLQWEGMEIEAVQEDTNSVVVQFSGGKAPHVKSEISDVSVRVVMKNNEFLSLLSYEYAYSAMTNGKRIHMYAYCRMSYDLQDATFQQLIPSEWHEGSGASDVNDSSARNSATESSVYTCTGITHTSLSEDDFLPSFYGFPNHLVGRDTAKSIFASWWMLLVIFNLAAISAFLVRRIQRRQG